MSDKIVDDKSSSGIALNNTLRGHTGVINQIAWSPDGQFLASGSNDRTIRLWDPQTGKHLHTLSGHTDWVRSIAWSPDGQLLASGSNDYTIRLWDPQTGKHLHTLSGHINSVRSIAWSPDGQLLASGSNDHTIRLWDPQTGKHLHTLSGHSNWVICIAWSPDGQLLASGSYDHTIRLWDTQTQKHLHTLSGHSSLVFCIAWSPDGQLLASGSYDGAIRLWSPSTGKQTHQLEGHTKQIISVSISSDGKLLVSKSYDGTVRIWHIDTRGLVALIKEPGSFFRFFTDCGGVAFHPQQPVLATLGNRDKTIRLWDINTEILFARAFATRPLQYTNAKVVLVGDSGVGKTGLSLALTGQPFVATESTHGRHVWSFDKEEIKFPDGRKELHEILLWDLAGQAGYRLIHQLHLNEVAVALIVFDFRSETNPFAGIFHWIRALHTVSLIQERSNYPTKVFLVAARVDRAGKSVSRERIDEMVRRQGFDGYFETSAKEGRNILELRKAIKQAINWDLLVKRTSTDLFQRIQEFLTTEKALKRLLSTQDELYRAYLRYERRQDEDVYAQFEACIGLVESRDLIRRFSFGNLVLLQPELLDAYASALINAVRDEPDGLGSISEAKVQAGNFSMSPEEQLVDKEQEKLLLIAMIEDLLRYEIALREQGDDGAYLVFPSQSTRENPDLPNPGGKAVIFSFEGPVSNIYTTLVVRLSHSGLFKKQDLWKNAVTYTTSANGTYGLYLNILGEGEGRAELTLFFDAAAHEEIRFHFEEYVYAHLQRRAIPEKLQRRRIFVCPNCATPLDDLQVTKRRERGVDWMTCGVCDSKVSLSDREERLTAIPASLVSKMDSEADKQRERSAAVSKLQGKIATEDFDVFLCHNNADKAKVKSLGGQLKEQGILPWLDEWELRPGLPWQRLLEKQIGQIKSVAVFVGKDGIGPWEQMELEAFLRQFVRRECPVIPVILDDASEVPILPLFLEGMTWVDFRKQDPHPMEQLIWGITGKHGSMLE